MAVTVKENVNPEVIEEPPPRPETPREGENEAATTARKIRDKFQRSQRHFTWR